MQLRSRELCNSKTEQGVSLGGPGEGPPRETAESDVNTVTQGCCRSGGVAQKGGAWMHRCVDA